MPAQALRATRHGKKEIVGGPPVITAPDPLVAIEYLMTSFSCSKSEALRLGTRIPSYSFGRKMRRWMQSDVDKFRIEWLAKHRQEPLSALLR